MEEENYEKKVIKAHQDMIGVLAESWIKQALNVVTLTVTRYYDKYFLSCEKVYGKDLDSLEELKNILKDIDDFKKLSRDYVRESIENGELAQIDLTFKEISDIPRRYLTASGNSMEILLFLNAISEGKINIDLDRSWIMQTSKKIHSLCEEAVLPLDWEYIGRRSMNFILEHFKKKTGFEKQLTTRRGRKERVTTAVHEALDELSKKHGESWRHFRLKKKFDLLWEHPIKGKKTLGKILEQEGLKKGKDGRQRTIEDMIKNHDVRGEKSGNLP